jgi:hypothetical protein
MVQGKTMQTRSNQQRDCLQPASRMVLTIFLVGADNLPLGEWEKINGPNDHECKLMQMVPVAQGAVNCNVAWPIVSQGHQDKKIILPNVNHEVEDATPG